VSGQVTLPPWQGHTKRPPCPCLIPLGTHGLNTRSPDTTPSPAGVAPILHQPRPFVGGGAAQQSAVAVAGKNKSGPSGPFVLVDGGEAADPPFPSPPLLEPGVAGLGFFFV